MGFFRSPFVIQHRVAATKIKDFVLGSDVTDAEKSMSQLFQIELHQYVFERNCLRFGLACQTLQFYAERMPQQEIGSAKGFFHRLMNEYRENLRQMNATEAADSMEEAISIYQIQETPPVPAIAANFVKRLTNDRLGPQDFDTLPQFLDLVDNYVKTTIDLVKDNLSKLK